MLQKKEINYALWAKIDSTHFRHSRVKVMLSKKAIEEYRKIYKKEYGEEITVAEAEEQGSRLLRLFEILLRIDKRNKDKK